MLAPVPPLTALKTLVAQRLKQEREMALLYHNILLIYGPISRIRLVSLMTIKPILLNGVLAIGTLMRCLVTRMTIPLTGGI